VMAVLAAKAMAPGRESGPQDTDRDLRPTPGATRQRQGRATWFVHGVLSSIVPNASSIGQARR
jgi:hypothetical protein